MLSTALAETVILVITTRNTNESTLAKSYQETLVMYKQIESIINQNDDYQRNSHQGSTSQIVDRDSHLKHHLKTQNDELIVCGKYEYENETEELIEIYNHTVFTLEELGELSFEYYEEQEYTYLNEEGRRYIIFHKGTGYEFYRFVDITDVRTELINLILVSVIITLVVTIIVSLTLSIILKKMLSPLHELTVIAEEMTEGSYENRIEITTNDEIGQLGMNFNKMADAVESRTKSLEESEKKKTLFMGNMTHELKTTKASELFKAAHESCFVNLRNKGITLEIKENGESFNVDFDLITNVLINIIDNAIKASDENSTIELWANKNEIVIKDYGCGIPSEEIDKITEPFYMIDKSRSRKSDGAGLGLALTSLIAQKHNIKLEVESEVGVGTKMILQFVKKTLNTC